MVCGMFVRYMYSSKSELGGLWQIQVKIWEKKLAKKIKFDKYSLVFLL